jgi:hypothetical protein
VEEGARNKRVSERGIYIYIYKEYVVVGKRVGVCETRCDSTTLHSALEGDGG